MGRQGLGGQGLGGQGLGGLEWEGWGLSRMAGLRAVAGWGCGGGMGGSWTYECALLMPTATTPTTPRRNGHGEAFSPVCLPHYNADAFLHAHIHYLDPNTGSAASGGLAGLGSCACCAVTCTGRVGRPALHTV